MTTQLADKRVVITGGAGFLGRHVVAEFVKRGADVFVPRRADYDLTDMTATRQLFADTRPEILVHLAAAVGGIGANIENPGRFFYANMAMGMNVIEQSRISGIEKLVVAGTVCSYPKFTPVPFREEDLWNGYPEETNAPYGVAKKALMVMMDAYRTQYGLNGVYLLPVNLYGPGDNFDKASSHVIPALMRKMLEAADTGADHIDVWGTGVASREFLYVDDAARAFALATERLDRPEPVNIGSGHEVTIKELVHLLADLTGFEGEIRWDPTKPDGQPRRMLDTTRAKEWFGFEAEVPLEEGLRRTLEWWKAEGSRG